MDILETLKQDYQHFPFEQTYSLYADNVYFKDPLSEFRGIERYQQMIDFMRTWFRDIQLDLHEIRRTENRIDTEWTLNWTAPLPWRPRIAIPGRSELILNDEGLIVSHIDYWHCSRFDAIAQHLFPKSVNSHS
jgi:hypothetical protein